MLEDLLREIGYTVIGIADFPPQGDLQAFLRSVPIVINKKDTFFDGVCDVPKVTGSVG